MPPSENGPHRLLVEGPDDRHSIVHLIRRHGFDWDAADSKLPYVNTAGGLPTLVDILPLEIRGPYDALGVVVDADDDVSSRWQQVRNAAAREGVVLPAAPDTEGTIVPGRRAGSSLGVWLMPDNSLSGTIETFLATLVPSREGCWKLAEKAVDAALAASCGRHADRAKHILHTWLAWSDPPGLPFGTALKAELFEKESAEATAFVNWFRRLYSF